MSNRKRNKNHWVLSRIRPIKGDPFLFCPGEQILDKIETICFHQKKSGNDTKKLWSRFQNGIGTFVPPFLTLLTGRGTFLKESQAE
jgi:hypothetical protein